MCIRDSSINLTSTGILLDICIKSIISLSLKSFIATQFIFTFIPNLRHESIPVNTSFKLPFLVTAWYLYCFRESILTFTLVRPLSFSFCAILTRVVPFVVRDISLMPQSLAYFIKSGRFGCNVGSPPPPTNFIFFRCV